jgi:uncharacterized protein
MDRSHQVDISGIVAGGRQSVAIADDVPIEPFEGVAFPKPAHVALELSLVGQTLAVTGTVDALARGSCDACLIDVERNLHVDVYERLDPNRGRDVDPFGESNVLTGQRLDVADLAQQVLLVALPMGLRCKDDCLGLCCVCGADRNRGECSCDPG